MSVKKIFPGIFKISLPLPGKKPGPVNIYVFKGKNISIIDTGTPLSIKTLRHDLLKIGVSFGDIDQIILTHGHVDHYSGVRLLQFKRLVKAEVYAHKADIPGIETGIDVPLFVYNRFLIRSGVPLMLRWGILLLFRWYGCLSLTCKVDHHLKNNDLIQLGDYQGKIIETPGHTRGSVCVFLERENVLFSGDHILGHITPITLPMLEKESWLPGRSSQEEFYESLNTIKKIKPKIICPGHGSPIHDFTQTHELHKRCFAQRQGDIVSILMAHKNKIIFGIAKILFPKLNKKNLLLEIFLAISEVYTHIQVLEKKGRLVIRSDRRCF